MDIISTLFNNYLSLNTLELYVYNFKLNYQLAKKFFSEKNYLKAIDYYQEALKVYCLLTNFAKANNNKYCLDSFLEDLESGKNLETELNDCYKDAGGAFYSSGDFEKAINCYKLSMLIDSTNHFVYYMIGLSFQNLGIALSSIEFLEKSLELNSQNHDIHRILGDICAYNTNNPEKAIDHYMKYIEFEKSNGLVYAMLGHLHEKLYKYDFIDKQLDFFTRAEKLAPSEKIIHKSLTIVYPRAGKYDEALNSFEKLIKLGPSMDDYFDLACFYIHLKNFEDGWKYYEYRFLKETNRTPYPNISKPKWNGENIKNKTLLVHYEQGFGDSIQFLRYIPKLNQFAEKVIFMVQDELVALLKNNKFNIEIVSNRIPLEELNFNYHIPLMSLPHLLNSQVEEIPFSEGYLEPLIDKVDYFKETYLNNDAFKIGISWQGNQSGNLTRNVPLELFYPLTKLSNVMVYSFQKGNGVDQLEKLPHDIKIHNMGSTFNDFSDTAAAMQNMDLFISSDNSVLNLAGALGKTAFLLLHKDSEWRWFSDEDKTPWYNSVRIFKQKEYDNWSEVMERVIEQLKKQLESQQCQVCFPIIIDIC